MNTRQATAARARGHNGARSDTGNVVMLSIGISLVLIAAAAVFFAVPQFQAMHQAFGVDLPHLTRWLVGYYPGLFLCVFIVPAIWLAWPNPARSGTAALLFALLLSGLLIGGSLFALYLPIFRLGAAVS